jgi:hypothetical protein
MKNYDFDVPIKSRNIDDLIVMKAIFFTCHIWNMRKCWFSVGKNEKKNIIADFNFLVLFMAKKHDLSDKNISVCHAPLPLPPFAKICTTPRASSLRARKLNFWFP